MQNLGQDPVLESQVKVPQTRIAVNTTKVTLQTTPRMMKTTIQEAGKIDRIEEGLLAALVEIQPDRMGHLHIRVTMTTAPVVEHRGAMGLTVTRT
jgi:hypothetical protein